MGQRALLVLERADGRYDLYYSHWGAHEWHLAGALARADGDATPVDVARLPAVDPEPVATDVPFEDILGIHVDYQAHEACYVVGDGPVRPYLVCWFGLPGRDTARPRDGALVSVDSAAPETDGEFLRGRLAGLKQGVLAAVRREGVAPAAARSLLATETASWADEGREIHLGPGSSGGRG